MNPNDSGDPQIVSLVPPSGQTSNLVYEQIAAKLMIFLLASAVLSEDYTFSHVTM